MIFHGVPLECINQAALHYQVPAVMIMTVMQQERGSNGRASKNANGTSDYGVMQINSRWLPMLSRQGITPHALQFNGCVNVEVGTWILAQGIANGEGWQGVGNYHSYTPRYNRRYREQIQRRYRDNLHLLQQRMA